MNIFVYTLLILSIPLHSFGKNYLNNSSFQKKFEAANNLFSQGKYHKAIAGYRRILRSRQDLPQVYCNLGETYMQIKEYHNAITAFESALTLKPDYAKVSFLLGQTYEASEKKPQAQLMYLRTLKSEPHHFDALIALAKMYTAENNFDEAIALYKRARNIQPKNATLLLDLAYLLNIQNQTEEALEAYYSLLALHPNYLIALHNIAFTLRKLNRIEEALPYYQRVLEMNPNRPDTRLGYGLALLIAGNKNAENWTKGWAEYEWRWHTSSRSKPRHFTQPLWQGQDLHEKTLFIWHEQGLGDTFQFIRYAHVAKTMGARKVIVAVQDAVYHIIKMCPYIDHVINSHETTPSFDYHIPMLSMPHYTKTTLLNVPHEIPYLFADPTLIDEWKELLHEDTNFKIGICWQGNLKYPTEYTRMTAAAKSMNLTQFLPLMTLPGVSVYSLQKANGTDQLNALPADASLIFFDGDFDESKGRFMDTAALMKNLDLIITVDTSICHLAAGLGVPTWSLLPNPADWRWMLDCDTTPWYPNMRLFRQPTPGDWEDVIQHVIIELTAHLENGKPLISFTDSVA